MKSKAYVVFKNEFIFSLQTAEQSKTVILLLVLYLLTYSWYKVSTLRTLCELHVDTHLPGRTYELRHALSSLNAP